MDEKIMCDCGVEYLKKNIEKHLTTKTHASALRKLNNTFTCECGVKLFKVHYERHINSEVHKVWMDNIKYIAYDEKRNIYNCECGGYFNNRDKIKEHVKGEIHKLFRNTPEGEKMPYYYVYRDGKNCKRYN